MICMFCKQEVGPDMPGHYAGDNCPWLLEAAGPVTAEGRLREKTFGSLCLGQSEGDKIERRNQWRAKQAKVKHRARKRPAEPLRKLSPRALA